MTGLPSPRYILVHASDATLDANALDNRAHAFGPFEDFDAVIAFDAASASDDCYRFAFPLVGPESRDIRIASDGALSGFRPGARMLPPRSGLVEHPFRRLIDQAMDEIRRVEKRQRKEAKRRAKAARKGFEG